MTTRLRGRSFADGAITAAKIATDAVTADKIAANAVGSSEINLAANYAFTGTVTGAGSNIQEMFSGVCDGRSLTVSSGTYTLQNVTTYQSLTNSYADITGSSITYTPPSGTTTVVYRFIAHLDSRGYSGINHQKFFIDSTEVIPAYRSVTPGEYVGNAHNCQGHVFEYTIQCNAGSDDAANAKFTSWTSSKTLKIQARRYSATYACDIHRNRYRDGGTATGDYVFAAPVLTIIAIK